MQMDDSRNAGLQRRCGTPSQQCHLGRDHNESSNKVRTTKWKILHAKKWPEQFPQRLEQSSPTTSRSAICHSSIGMTRKSRLPLGVCHTVCRRPNRMLVGQGAKIFFFFEIYLFNFLKKKRIWLTNMQKFEAKIYTTNAFIYWIYS